MVRVFDRVNASNKITTPTFRALCAESSSIAIQDRLDLSFNQNNRVIWEIDSCLHGNDLKIIEITQKMRGSLSAQAGSYLQLGIVLILWMDSRLRESWHKGWNRKFAYPVNVYFQYGSNY